MLLSIVRISLSPTENVLPFVDLVERGEVLGDSAILVTMSNIADEVTREVDDERRAVPPDVDDDKDRCADTFGRVVRIERSRRAIHRDFCAREKARRNDLKSGTAGRLRATATTEDEEEAAARMHASYLSDETNGETIGHCRRQHRSPIFYGVHQHATSGPKVLRVLQAGL